jgi:hypothetical protein
LKLRKNLKQSMKTKFMLPLLLALGIGSAAISATVVPGNAKESTVLICNSPNAYAYHSHKCSGLQRCKSNVLSIKLSEAKKAGRSACKICYK